MKRVVGPGAVALAVVLAVVFAGFAPAAGGPGGADGSADADGSAAAVESSPTATPAASAGPSATDSTGDGGSTPASTTPAEPRFAFAIDRIEACGQTCRDVTTTLTNDGAAASSVTVSTRIYAGNGTDGEVVWEGREPVGDLGAGESYTTTERVDLSFGGALAVQGTDGWITVRTTVESDERTVTFTQQRDVL